MKSLSYINSNWNLKWNHFRFMEKKRLNDYFHQFQEFYASFQTLSLKQLSYIPKPTDLFLLRYDDGLITVHVWKKSTKQMLRHSMKTMGISKALNSMLYSNGARFVMHFHFRTFIVGWTTFDNCPVHQPKRLIDSSATTISTRQERLTLWIFRGNTLLVKLTNPFGRDVIGEIKEYVFSECIV